MIVVVADHLPPAVRGRMKLWFVEVRPNVFVSGAKGATATRVVEDLFQYCPPSSGLTIFQQIPKAPGYTIRTMGDPKRRLVHLSGMPLIEEKQGNVQ